MVFFITSMILVDWTGENKLTIVSDQEIILCAAPLMNSKAIRRCPSLFSMWAGIDSINKMRLHGCKQVKV